MFGNVFGSVPLSLANQETRAVRSEELPARVSEQNTLQEFGAGAGKLQELRRQHVPGIAPRGGRKFLDGPNGTLPETPTQNTHSGFKRLVVYLLPTWLLRGVQNLFQKISGINLDLVPPAQAKPANSFSPKLPSQQHGALRALESQRARVRNFKQAEQSANKVSQGQTGVSTGSITSSAAQNTAPNYSEMGW